MTSETNSDKDSSAARLPPATWLGIAALVVSLLAAGAAVFAWYQVAVTGRLEVGEQRAVVDRVAGEFDAIRQGQESTGARITALDDRFDKALAELESSMRSLRDDTEQALEREGEARKQRMGEFRQEFDALSQSVERVYEDLGRSVDTWMLEEAEQLLLLANQRLTLVQDAELATTALRLADQKLEEIGDPALIPVRSRIADELARLNAVPSVDVEGAALRLDALSDTVVDMPLSQDLEGPEWEFGEPAKPTGENGESTFGALARDVLDDLGALVRIKRVEETRLPRLKPVQRFLVHENLRLALASAQYALLRGDARLFAEHIEAARTWTGRYYDSGAEPVTKFMAELDQLANLPLARNLPSISGSLEMLREKMSERTSK